MKHEKVAATARHESFSWAYVGSVVPDEASFRTAAFGRAGNRSQRDLLAGLRANGASPAVSMSVLAIPAFPRSRRLWVGSCVVDLGDGLSTRILPFVNIMGIKQFMLGLGTVAKIMAWAWRNRGRPRLVYSFNLTMPPGLLVWLAARLIGARYAASIYDVNVPGQTVPDTWAFRLDFAAQKWLIPRLDGRVCVTDAIAEDLAPVAGYIRVEGGVTSEVAAMMDAAGPARTDDVQSPFTVVCVGRIDQTNGFDLLLDALDLAPDLELRVIVAGRGPLDTRLRDASATDPRLDYRGFVSLSEVVSLYAEADFLLNLRRTTSMQTRYFFPSKLLEYLLTGVPVLSTATGHVREEYGDVLEILADETPAGLVRALRGLATREPEESRKLGATARAFMLENKRWDLQAARILDYLGGEVMAGANARGQRDRGR